MRRNNCMAQDGADGLDLDKKLALRMEFCFG